MFWTIVGALIFVFFIAPFVIQFVMSILSAIFDSDEKVGCIVFIVIGIILLMLIF